MIEAVNENRLYQMYAPPRHDDEELGLDQDYEQRCATENGFLPDLGGLPLMPAAYLLQAEGGP